MDIGVFIDTSLIRSMGAIICPADSVCLVSVGRSATSLEEVLIFATSVDMEPAVGFSPAPSLSFLHSVDSVDLLPQRQPENNHLLLPVLPSYQLFKRHMEYAVCQLTVVQQDSLAIS